MALTHAHTEYHCNFCRHVFHDYLAFQDHPCVTVMGDENFEKLLAFYHHDHYRERMREHNARVRLLHKMLTLH